MAVYKGAAFTSQAEAGGTRYFSVAHSTAHDPAVPGDHATFEQDVNTTGTVTVIYRTSVTGLTPPGAPNTIYLDLYHADTNTLVGSRTLTAPADGSTHDIPVNSNGSFDGTGTEYAGDFRLRIRAVRTDLTAYDVNSDTTNQKGFVRVNPTTINVQMWHSGATDPASYADNIEVNVDLSNGPGLDLSHRHFDVRAIDAVSATQYAVQRTEGTDPQNTLMKVDNRFPAAQVSVNIDVEIVAVPSAIAPDSEPTATWIIIPAATADRVDGSRVRKGPIPVDATIYVDTHLQVNDNVYDAAKSVESRLTSDLGFVTGRISNARGVLLGGITYRSVLHDEKNLVPPAVDRTVTTEAATGRPSTMASWDSQLPGGLWLHDVTITSPADAVGLEHMTSEWRTLVAGNPALALVTGAGPSGQGNDVRHVEPGMTVLVGLTILNVFTKRQVPIDTGTAKAVIARFNLALGRAEYLASDGTWMPTSTTTDLYFWTLDASPGDPNTYIRTFDSTGWGVADLFVIGVASVAGVPLTNYMKEVVVSGVNNHDIYKFDGAGFLGFPSR